MDLRSVNRVLRERGLSTAYYRRKKGEDLALFTDRIAKQLVRILPKLDGEVPLVARLYDVPDNIISAIIQDKRYARYNLKDIRSKAHAEGRAKENEHAEITADLERAKLESLTEVKDKRITRERWPSDPEAKADAIFDYLSVALVQYGSDLVVISETGTKGTLTLPDIIRALENSPALQEEQRVGKKVQGVMSESNMYRLGREANNPSAAMKVLTNVMDGEWSDRQEHTHKHVGFEPPKEGEGASILDAFKSDSAVVSHDGEGTEQ